MSSWMSEWRVRRVEKVSSSPPLRQVAVDEQISHFDEPAVLRELLDWDAAVAQDALFAVEERDRALRRRGVHESRVEGDEAGLRA